MSVTKKPEVDQKWAVYLAQTGRTPPGIYHRHVVTAGRHAFVFRAGESRTADIIPRQNIFETEAAAQLYFAKKGHLRWAVYEGEQYGNRPRPPYLFQAYVGYYTSEGCGRHRFGGNVAIKAVDEKDPEAQELQYKGSRNHYTFFDKKKDALKYFRGLRKHWVQKANKKIVEAKRELKVLAATAAKVR